MAMDPDDKKRIKRKNDSFLPSAALHATITAGTPTPAVTTNLFEMLPIT